MKKIPLTIVAAVSITLCAHAQAQNETSALADVCHADFALTDYLSEKFGTSTGTPMEELESSEKLEVDGLLNDPSLASATNSEKFTAVMTACEDGEILQHRFGLVINQ